LRNKTHINLELSFDHFLEDLIPNPQLIV